jgi:hypothetical protein
MESSAFTGALTKAVLTYHALFGVPIKEANWESLLSQTAESCDVRCAWAPGSHVSGVDIALNGKTFSCKSARRNTSGGKPPANIAISSYRLTKSSGSAASLVKEIDVVRANYDAYALLLRESRNRAGGGELIDRYKVYSIPAAALKAGALDWAQTEKGDWIGTPSVIVDRDSDEDDSDGGGAAAAPAAPAAAPVPYAMKVVKTMSCQLWITVPVEYIAKYLVCEIDMAGAKRINMVSLYDSIYSEKTETEPDAVATVSAIAEVAAVAAPPLSGDAGDEAGYVFPGKEDEESAGSGAGSDGDLDELAGALTALIVSELAAGVDKK